MSTQNIGFYEDLTKLSLNYHQISSNTHLISSAVLPRINVSKRSYGMANSEESDQTLPVCPDLT